MAALWKAKAAAWQAKALGAAPVAAAAVPKPAGVARKAGAPLVPPWPGLGGALGGLVAPPVPKGKAAGPRPPPPVVAPMAGGPGALLAAAMRAAPGFGGPAVPVLPAVPKFPGLPAAPVARVTASLDSPWIDSVGAPGAIDGLPLDAGTLVEIATHDGAGRISGTALFQVNTKAAPDAEGIFLEVKAAGASDPATRLAVDAAFPGSLTGLPHAVVHICRAGFGTCPATLPAGRLVLHADVLRTRGDDHLVETRIRPEFLPGPPQATVTVPKVGPGKTVAGKLATAAVSNQARLDVTQKRKKKKKKKKRDRSSSSSGGSSSDEEQLFRGGIVTKDKEGELRRFAQDHPGQLYQQGLKEISKYLGSRAMPSTHAAEEQPQPVMMTYLLSIFMNASSIEKV